MPTTTKRPRRTKAQIEQARRRREANRRHNLKTRHHMTLKQYDDMLRFQGGHCYMCPHITGKTRSLSVDHDHAYAREHCEHPHDESCINCWRGLICATCNRMFGHAHDDPEFFRRALEYLKHPPARRWRLTQNGMEDRT